MEFLEHDEYARKRLLWTLRLFVINAEETGLSSSTAARYFGSLREALMTYDYSVEGNTSFSKRFAYGEIDDLGNDMKAMETKTKLKVLTFPKQSQANKDEKICSN